RADTAARIEARTLAAADLAQPRLEVERRRGDLLVAEEKALRAERALKLLLADGPGDPLWDVALAAADAPDATPVPVSLADALADAMRYRPELAERRAEVAAEEAKVAFARDNIKPRLDAYASVALRELAGDRHDDIISLPGLVPTLPNGLYPDASAGVVFDVPLGRRAARGALGAAAADHRQAVAAQSDTEDRIAAEVRNAATAIDTAARRLEAARAGLDAAGTQLRAEQDRFGVGASTNFFVLTRQNDLAIAQLAENSALTDFQKARSELARATGTLLRDRGIQLGTSPAER
ncbi:MAG: TolC family protein, partial [Acidobacteriota bacterium]